MQLCKRCGYEWQARIRNPIMCPKCKSRGWWFCVPNKCDVCRRMFNTLSEHHIDGNRDNTSKTNRTKLCSDCHSVIHSGLREKDRQSNGKVSKSRTRKYKNQPEVRNKLLKLINVLYSTKNQKTKHL